ncbi:putative protein kinase [Plasmopara halstedii]
MKRRMDGNKWIEYHRKSRGRVAIKEISGLQKTRRYEANILIKCQGTKHVVQLLDVDKRDDKLYLVLEYMNRDLEVLIGAERVSRCLTSIAYLGILHCDLKRNNLLLSMTQSCAKITDFGMVTFITTHDENGKIDEEKIANDDKKQKRSVHVVTRAYLDMLSVGCIFAEMLLRRPLADESSDIDQLSKIFAFSCIMPFYLRFQDTNPLPLVEQFSMLSAAGVDLLS